MRGVAFNGRESKEGDCCKTNYIENHGYNIV
jgi:hypothetical protein